MSALLLRDVSAFVRRFVVLDDDQALAVTLWAAHSHALEAAEATPYLAVTSPEKRSGKSRLLEVLELLVREPLPTANISDAALFRVVGEREPTMLMDEVDAIFTARDREELRGLLNAGHRRGAVAFRMGGANNRTLESFPVFCAKAFAGIGNCLPDTIVDRSIPIRLKRRLPHEQVERFRRRDVEPAGGTLRDRLADWVDPQLEHLQRARPQLPEVLDDRAQDVWEPLLAIADLVGDGWPEHAREAALALSSGENREDDSLTALLLANIAAVFEASGEARMKTAALLEGLHAIEESPWGDHPVLTAHGLSKLLRPYRIKTMAVKAEGKTVRGYKLEQFADAFLRVLGVTGVTSVTPESARQAEGNARNVSNAYPVEAAPVPAPASRLGDDDYQRGVDEEEIERLAELARRSQGELPTSGAA